MLTARAVAAPRVRPSRYSSAGAGGSERGGAECTALPEPLASSLAGLMRTALCTMISRSSKRKKEQISSSSTSPLK